MNEKRSYSLRATDCNLISKELPTTQLLISEYFFQQCFTGRWRGFFTKTSVLRDYDT